MPICSSKAVGKLELDGKDPSAKDKETLGLLPKTSPKKKDADVENPDKVRHCPLLCYRMRLTMYQEEK